MRFVRRLLVFLFVVSCPLLSKAVTIRVQDPNYANIVSTPYSFSFSTCPSASDPNGPYLDGNNVISADGCSGGGNHTGSTITSLTLTFKNTKAVQDSGANVAGSDIFQNASFVAPADPANANEDYSFLFSGNGLTEGQTFVITEDGVTNPNDFPLVTLTYTNATTAVTPEPSSLLLMATGLVCMGCFYRRYQRT